MASSEQAAWQAKLCDRSTLLSLEPSLFYFGGLPAAPGDSPGLAPERFKTFPWYHGHKRGTHGRLITQFMPTRHRTGPLSSLITGHSKFTPIENTKNSCHGGMWTVVFCTRYRPANIRVIAPIWAVSRHLGGPHRAHHSPRPASDCLAHYPSTPASSSLPPSQFDYGTTQGSCSVGYTGVANRER